MKCLDHIDMAVMAGTVTVLASAAFFFAYLGAERAPLVLPAPIGFEAMIQEDLGRAMTGAQTIPERVIQARERTQVALGEAIVRLGATQSAEASFIPALAERAAAGAKARREFLEGVFKLPADWRGAEFAKMERAAEALAQPVLGRMIVASSRALDREMAAAEAQYGRAVVASAQARGREAIEPAASQGTILAAAMAIGALAERTATAPAPVIVREPGWGFGSIGDGVFLAFGVLGGGAMLLLAAGAGMAERGASTRTIEAYCGPAGKDVQVTMLVAEDTPYEVAHCSAFNGGPVTCQKHCLTWPVAHAHAA